MTSKLFEATRATAFSPSGLLCRYGSFRKENGISLVVADYDISKRWYQTTKNANFSVSVELAVYLVHIGRSSVHLYNEMMDAHGHEFGKCLLKMVFIDRTTRKSKAIPDWIRQDLKQDVNENLLQLRSRETDLLKEANIPLTHTIPAKPEGAFHHSIKINPSEIDRNKHTNNTHYIRFCMDCASLALWDRKLPNFHGDVALYNVHKAKVLYSRETVLGDVLNVFVWPSEASPLELCFSIQNLGETIFSCIVSFYPLTTSKY